MKAKQLANKIGKYLGSGHSRDVFDLGDGTVLKLPVSKGHGERVNRSEAQVWETSSMAERKRLAECELVRFGGRDCLIMEKVNPFSAHDRKPEWAHRHWDGAQVGRNLAGMIVRYDYARFIY